MQTRNGHLAHKSQIVNRKSPQYGLADPLLLWLHRVMSNSLNEHLSELNGEVLKSLAQKMAALEKGMTRKDQFAAAVERQLTCNLAGFVSRLTETEKLLLAESVHQGRLLTVREFEAKHGLACPMPKGNYSYGARDVPLLAALIHIPGYRYDEGASLISQLVEPLQQLLPKPPKTEVRTQPALPESYHFKHRYRDVEQDRLIHVFESERIAPAELTRVLRLIQAAKVKVTDASQRPTDAAARSIGEVLLAPDFALEPPKEEIGQWTELAGPVRAHAWGVLVQQCGWAKNKGGVLTLTPAGQALLQQFSPEKFREGVSKFIEDDKFDELHRVNHIRGQSGKAKRRISDPGSRKMAVSDAVTACPAGQWLEFKEVRRIIDASGADWDVQPGDRWGLYFGELQYGGISDTQELNSQFLRALFLESFATLGLLDVAYCYPHSLWPEFSDSWGTDDLSFCGRYDGLLYVRLNPLGAYAFDLTEQYELRIEVKPKLFRVLPNLEIVLSHGQPDPADRACLELLAAPKSDLVWAIDAQRILTHIESGGTFKELKEFLDANVAGVLPENVQVFLAGIENKLTACLRGRDAVVFEWSDAALAQLIATSSGTNKLCFYAGENRLAVLKEDLRAFSRAVKKVGYVVPAAR